MDVRVLHAHMTDFLLSKYASSLLNINKLMREFSMVFSVVLLITMFLLVLLNTIIVVLLNICEA